jgi:hypothetical protein
MNNEVDGTTETIQKLIVEIIATHPAGHRLCLIGGFRYRLLNQSCRTSVDIDYHSDGDLERKQEEIADLLTKRLLPEVRKRFGYDGQARKATGPEADSPFVKTVAVAFDRTGEHPDRIEVPVEITSIPCADAPVVRTMAGTVYLTASDADMAESKVVAIFNRPFVEVRDIIDLFLFQNQFTDASAQRLQVKFAKLGIGPQSVATRIHKLVENREPHVRALGALIKDQIDTAAAANLEAAGGGGMIFDAVVALLNGQLKAVRGEPS